MNEPMPTIYALVCVGPYGLLCARSCVYGFACVTLCMVLYVHGLVYVYSLAWSKYMFLVWMHLYVCMLLCMYVCLLL